MFFMMCIELCPLQDQAGVGGEAVQGEAGGQGGAGGHPRRREEDGVGVAAVRAGLQQQVGRRPGGGTRGRGLHTNTEIVYYSQGVPSRQKTVATTDAI